MTVGSTNRLEIDLNDINDIITAPQAFKFANFIINEDFYCLSADTQRSFASSLKDFHEKSLSCFIVVGVWREQNRLFYYNPGRTSRGTRDRVNDPQNAGCRDPTRLELSTRGETVDP
ncbi:hypothetical protein [Methylobacterium tarhaniae]|uniref:hypothetical protein n=1 Tax=Methylobacterium tarhaniae TaxID=1187852 RepID=UPI003D04CBA2